MKQFDYEQTCEDVQVHLIAFRADRAVHVQERGNLTQTIDSPIHSILYLSLKHRFPFRSIQLDYKQYTKYFR